MTSNSSAKKLIYLVTEDWFFVSHFLERALAARQAGYDVAIATRIGREGETIRQAGLRVLPVEFERRSLNPRGEAHVIEQITRHYRTERPDIVHHFGLKPVLLGSLAARRAGVRHIVNAPVGMGSAFTARGAKGTILRFVITNGLRHLVDSPSSKVVFENRDDLDEFVRRGFVRPDHAVLIRGAGVDVEAIRPSPEPPGTPVVLLVSRMLYDKGIAEFVEAARLLAARGVRARLVLVGAPDAANPSSIPQEVLEDWKAQGPVEWLGHRDDVPDLLEQSHIACLPSYREGLPKSLLEAMAAGRPIVATDVQGCREAVTDGDNGFLVPPRDPRALAQALERLIRDPELRQRMGQRGRERVEAEFASSIVIGRTLDLYAGFGA